MFNYFPRNTGSVQQFVTPKLGSYKLEVWGAGSLSAKSTSGYSTEEGKGGYAKGTYDLTLGAVLYLYIGGAGNTNSGISGGTGGYNGGGNGGTGVSYAGGSGGGGATHIATTSGLLSSLVNNKNSIIIVAGGSGGCAVNSGAGYGGGITGGDSSTAGWTPTGINKITILGGSQAKGYAFGQGQNVTIPKTQGSCGAEGNGGGGGGYYGGYAFIGDGDGSCCGGTGGSGYIGGVSNGTMENGVRSGNGYCIVSWIP